MFVYLSAYFKLYVFVIAISNFVITGTTDLVPFHSAQVTATYWKIKYLKIRSTGTRSSNKLQWLELKWGF